MTEKLPVSRGSNGEVLALPAQAAAFACRAAILDAVVREVAAVGFADASVARVAARAGVTEAAFREHFAGTEDAVVTAYDLAAAFAIPRIRAAFGREREWADGARAALATYVALLDRDHDWALVCLGEIAEAGAGGASIRRMGREPLVQAVNTPVSLSGAADLPSLLAALDGAIVDALRREPDVSLRHRQHELVQLVLAPIVGIGPPGAARDMVAPASARGLEAPRAAIEVAASGPDAAQVLGVLVRDAAARRDGPVLWEVVAVLRQRRADGHPVPRAIERQALDALDDAWSFGLFGLCAA